MAVYNAATARKVTMLAVIRELKDAVTEGLITAAEFDAQRELLIAARCRELEAQLSGPSPPVRFSCICYYVVTYANDL